jgi:hypothetical protein
LPEDGWPDKGKAGRKKAQVYVNPDKLLIGVLKRWIIDCKENAHENHPP